MDNIVFTLKMGKPRHKDTMGFVQDPVVLLNDELDLLIRAQVIWHHFP